MHISKSEIKNLALQVLSKHGYTAIEAEAIYEAIFWAEMRGNSQGLGKLFGWRIAKRGDAGVAMFEKSEDSMVLINGMMNSHILAAKLATEQILSHAKDKSIFVAGIKNVDNSAGALGYYTERLAQAGYVAIMMSAADPGVVPFGGSKSAYGTNPISIAVPTKTDPLLLDMSVAGLTWGDLVSADIEGKQLPEGYAYDETGKPTTDPKKAMDGSVTTFDKSFKGSGLALMIQILAGPLVGSIYNLDYNQCQYGSLIIVLNPKKFGGKEVFIERVQDMIRQVKSVDKAEGFDEITMPGELGYRKYQKNMQSEEIEVADELIKKMRGFVSE